MIDDKTKIGSSETFYEISKIVRVAQMIAGVFEIKNAGGKSELHRAGCSVTRSRGDAKESATERKPPCELACLTPRVRVKGCGKSAPVLQATGEAW